MGMKSETALQFESVDELASYLGTNHAAYVKFADGKMYYLTDCNEHYWRVQRTDVLNEKGHYVDDSELVPTAAEFVKLPFKSGASLADLFAEAKFFASVKE